MWKTEAKLVCTPSKSANLTQFANERSYQEDFALEYTDISTKNNSHGKYQLVKRVLKVLLQLVKVEGLLGVCRVFFHPRVCHWLSNLRYFLRCHSNFKYRDDRNLSRARQFSAEFIRLEGMAHISCHSLDGGRPESIA